eukprot:GHVS01026614.1.p1 GENE.GHVS01026614.1~~GHVS01026614.1.p1  ORF type:complete len:1182 (+),score=263.91 GHVS01026614.1:139-3684(+)
MVEKLSRLRNCLADVREQCISEPLTTPLADRLKLFHCQHYIQKCKVKIRMNVVDNQDNNSDTLSPSMSNTSLISATSPLLAIASDQHEDFRVTTDTPRRLENNSVQPLLGHQYPHQGPNTDNGQISWTEPTMDNKSGDNINVVPSIGGEEEELKTVNTGWSRVRRATAAGGGGQKVRVQAGSCISTSDVPHEYQLVTELMEGESFGEKGLLGNEDRSAMIRTHTSCEMLAVGKDDFHKVFAAELSRQHKRKIAFLSKWLPGAATQQENVIDRLSYYFKEDTKHYGTVIMQQDEQADKLYIIKKGKCGLTHHYMSAPIEQQQHTYREQQKQSSHQQLALTSSATSLPPLSTTHASSSPSFPSHPFSLSITHNNQHSRSHGYRADVAIGELGVGQLVGGSCASLLLENYSSTVLSPQTEFWWISRSDVTARFPRPMLMALRKLQNVQRMWRDERLQQIEHYHEELNNPANLYRQKPSPLLDSCFLKNKQFILSKKTASAASGCLRLVALQYQQDESQSPTSSLLGSLEGLVLSAVMPRLSRMNSATDLLRMRNAAAAQRAEHSAISLHTGDASPLSPSPSFPPLVSSSGSLLPSAFVASAEFSTARQKQAALRRLNPYIATETTTTTTITTTTTTTKITPTDVDAHIATRAQVSGKRTTGAERSQLKQLHTDHSCSNDAPFVDLLVAPSTVPRHTTTKTIHGSTSSISSNYLSHSSSSSSFLKTSEYGLPTDSPAAAAAAGFSAPQRLPPMLRRFLQSEHFVVSSTLSVDGTTTQMSSQQEDNTTTTTTTITAADTEPLALRAAPPRDLVLRALMNQQKGSNGSGEWPSGAGGGGALAEMAQRMGAVDVVSRLVGDETEMMDTNCCVDEDVAAGINGSSRRRVVPRKSTTTTAETEQTNKILMSHGNIYRRNEDTKINENILRVLPGYPPKRKQRHNKKNHLPITHNILLPPSFSLSVRSSFPKHQHPPLAPIHHTFHNSYSNQTFSSPPLLSRRHELHFSDMTAGAAAATPAAVLPESTTTRANIVGLLGGGGGSAIVTSAGEDGALLVSARHKLSEHFAMETGDHMMAGRIIAMGGKHRRGLPAAAVIASGVAGSCKTSALTGVGENRGVHLRMPKGVTGRRRRSSTPVDGNFVGTTTPGLEKFTDFETGGGCVDNNVFGGAGVVDAVGAFLKLKSEGSSR